MLAGYGVEREYPNWHLKLVRIKKIKDRKTNIYKVIKVVESYGDKPIGYIKWDGAFRQFVFSPDNNTIWSKGCLELIIKFLDDKNKRHRMKLQKIKKQKEV